MTDKELIDKFYKLAFSVSSLLLVASAVVHFVTFAPINIADAFPPIYLLHVGIFALIIPIVFIERVLKNSPSVTKSGSPNDEMVDNASDPGWFMFTCLILGAYAALNFLIFFLTYEGNPKFEAGLFWLEDHGKVIREISQAEYDAVSAKRLHGFSGHWLVFYFYIAGSSFLSIKKRKSLSAK